MSAVVVHPSRYRIISGRRAIVDAPYWEPFWFVFDTQPKPGRRVSIPLPSVARARRSRDALLADDARRLVEVA